jgi:hypothetical protein
MCLGKTSLCFSAVAALVSARALANEPLQVENACLRRAFSTEGGVLRTVEIANKRAGVTVRPTAAPEFRLRLSQGTQRPETAFTLTAADFRVEKVDASKETLTVALACASRPIRVVVEYRLGPNDFFMRKRLTVTSAQPLTLERVDVEAFGLADAYQPYTVREITANAPGRWSPGLGQPLYGAQSATFWGVEFPAADNHVAGGELTAGYLYGRPLEPGKPYATHAAVMGVADDPAFVKDAFFEYIERVRARPLRLQVQFNSWFDTGGGVNKANFAASVAKIHQELVVARGCRPLSAYVIDDGWQDTQADWSDKVWKANAKFEPDFASTLAAVKAADSRLGLWLSPGCLFGASRQVPKLREKGFEALDDWMSMAGPKYMDALEGRMVELTRQGVGYFKLDGIFGHLNLRNFELHGERYGLPELPQLLEEGLKGNDARLNDPKYDELKIYYLSAGTERLIQIFKKQAEVNPEVFITISNGAWLSPWWLMHVDAVWMINAGDAAGGSSRTAELVYRDERYHEFWTRQNAQFPLSAVFNHEPKKLNSKETKETFRKYLYMNLSRGTGFIELYIKPDRLAAYDWDVLAEGLQWAYEVFPTFARVRMHGGNPGTGEVYGYTAWQGEQGYVSAHNPTDGTRTYTVRLDRAFGLPPGGGMFHVRSPLEGSARGLPEVVYAGDALELALEPREIRILNFGVQPKDWAALKRLQGRTAADYVPAPEPKPAPVGDHPLLGVWAYASGGGAYTREFKKDGTCVLRQGGTEIWTKIFKPDGANSLVVEDRYRHELKPDGTLLIEGRYTAKREK